MLNTNIKMLIRQDAISEMQQLNPIPNKSEMIIVAPDPDTGRPVKFAFGDGVTHYNSLVFYDFPTTGSGETITVINNLTEITPGSALDAVQGRILNETKANIDSPNFTGIPKISGANIATINNIPAQLSALTNDVGFIVNSVDSLINYYTRTQVNDLFANFSSLNILIVTVLPTENISTTTIYLVPKNPTQSDNIYTEYIRVSDKWEIIGDTSVDLTDYLKKTGDGSDVTSTISIQTGVANLISGEKLSVMFGKIQKWIEYFDTRTLPAGGAINQILAKSSANNYEVVWVDPATAVIPENVVYYNATTIPAEVIVMAGDSLKFGGQLPEYYATAQSISSYTNDNLIMNWDFRFPINQRNATSYTSGYSIDRWILDPNNGGVSLSVQDGFVRLTQTNVAGGTYSQAMCQKIENPQLYSGMTVTLSVEHRNTKVGKMLIYAGSGVLADSVTSLPVSVDWTITSVTVTLPTMTSLQWAAAYLYSDMSGSLGYVDYRRVKLELGSKSTLANDAPMNYGPELVKCQRYFYRLKSVDLNNYAIFGVGGCISITQFRCVIPLPNTLRISPSLSSSGAFKVASWDATNSAVVSSFTRQSFNGNSIVLIANVASIPLGTSGYVQANNDATCYIDFSADL